MNSPKVTMINRPEKIGTVLDIIWQTSKTSNNINMREHQFPVTLLRDLMKEQVPVLRHFYFTFLIEDMSIAFREQLVRTKYDHYWIQSGRITDWTNVKFDSSKISTAGDGELLKGIKEQEAAIKIVLRDYFQTCKSFGIPPEQYRDLVPVGALHRGIWTVNLESLLTRFKKRTCWVAQSDLWFPILTQVAKYINDFITSVHISLPPCVDHDVCWTGCKVHNTMMDRYEGTDPLQVCPLWCLYSDRDHLIMPKEPLVGTSKFEEMWGFKTDEVTT